MCPEKSVKLCKKCQESKPPTEFYLRDGKPVSPCKDCVKQAAKRWHQANRERYNENQSRWRKAHPEVRKRIKHAKRQRH